MGGKKQKLISETTSVPDMEIKPPLSVEEDCTEKLFGQLHY